MVTAINKRTAQSNSIASIFGDRTPISRDLFDRSSKLFPSGITHDSRQLDPYPVYVDRAQGPLKWDVDGNEYVDYIGGHGALLLGHNDPDVDAAVREQLAKGSHYGASHRLEAEWGEAIQRLIPSAERIRFTNSGTEATLLGLRLVRAVTGKPRVLRFAGHFHGWHDHATIGHMSNYDSTPTIGVLPGVAENVIVAPPGDLARAREILESDDRIAAVIIEPTGSTFGRVPIEPEFLKALRDITARLGVVLIFDEVITGFRVSRGGAQGFYGVTPDMTSLAKIVAGGYPGAAIVGRKDLLDPLDYEVTRGRGSEKVRHQGTFNANPISAAAGVAALAKIASSDACARANSYGERIRSSLNALFAEEGVAWAAYGKFSAFHIFTNSKRRPIDPRAFDATECPMDELRNNEPSVLKALRLSLLINGVDIANWPGGIISATHDDDCLERTIAAFRASLRMMRAEGLV